MSDTRRLELNTYAMKVEGTEKFEGQYAFSGYTGIEHILYRGVVTQKGIDKPARFNTESEAKEAAERIARQAVNRLNGKSSVN